MKLNLCLPALALLVAVSLAHGQGSLTPPGAPQPTMKTLQQVEPRTPIGSLPFVITNSGSYYLTGTLTGTNGQTGITVSADNVTIDLSGFALTGLPASLNGILVSTNVKNLSVVNGTVNGWSLDCISAANAYASRFEQLRLMGAFGVGLKSGTNAVVTGCTVLNCTVGGIVVGAGSHIAGNTVANNGTVPIVAGIRVSGAGSRIDGNHVTGGSGIGIRIESAGNLIVRNSVIGTGAAAYSIVAGNDFGQILSPGANFTNDVPWANFGTGSGGMCGNFSLEFGEACDDGNNVNGDGCTSACAVQAGYNCTGSPSTCTPICGDGLIVGSEQCDDSNTNNGDGCSSTCQIEPCVTASQCPGTDTECQTRTCTSGVCGFNYTASGFVVASQTPGDCQKNVCNGVGGVVNTADNADVPNDGNACTSDSCVAGIPMNQPAPLNSPCAQGGGVVCNASGQCVQCNSASQCPGTDTICQSRTCTANTCGMSFASAATACTAPSCASGVASPADVCNGAGTCVDSGTVNCAPYACNGTGCSTSCSNDSNCQSGFYCSGSACVAKKAQGSICTGTNECSSGFCVDGFCCSSACNSTCQACSAAKKGSGANGACGNIANNTDPDNECSGGLGVCNGAGACN